MLICDYFGWRAPRLEEIISLCRSRRVAVIRDCCHSAFSWSQYDPMADITFFSYRKILPVCEGGALLFNGNLKNNSGILDQENRQCIHMRLTNVFERLVFEYSLFNPYIIIDFLRRLRLTNKGLNEKSVLHRGPIIPSQELLSWLSNDLALKRVVISRVFNTRKISQIVPSLGNLRPLFSRVNEGDVPQVFPILIADAAKFIRFLRSKGVGAFSWPGSSIPAQIVTQKDMFPNALSINF